MSGFLARRYEASISWLGGIQVGRQFGRAPFYRRSLAS